MALYQWQTNDPMSLFNNESGLVYLGYNNFKNPNWLRDFQFMIEFGQSLMEPTDILTPPEAFDHWLGNLIESRYAPLQDPSKSSDSDIYAQYRSAPESLVSRDYIDRSNNSRIRSLQILRIPSVIHERVQIQRILQMVIRYMRRSSNPTEDSMYGLTYTQIQSIPQTPSSFFSLNIFQQQAVLLAADELADKQASEFYAKFIAKLTRFLSTSLDPTSAPATLRARFRRSRYAESVPFEDQMQVTVNALSDPTSNQNVFSRLGHGGGADEVLDMVTAAFCRVISIGRESPNVDLVPNTVTWAVPLFDEKLSAYYPETNFMDVPSELIGSRSTIREKRGLITCIRIYCQELAVAQSFGKKNALVEIFKRAPNNIRKGIINTLYPYDFGADLSNPNSVKSNRQKFFIQLNGQSQNIDGKSFIATVCLMDYLNTDLALRTHTINYLRWVKVRCLEAARRQPMRDLSILPRLISNVKTFDPSRNLQLQIAQLQQPGISKLPLTITHPETSSAESAGSIPAYVGASGAFDIHDQSVPQDENIVNPPQEPELSDEELALLLNELNANKAASDDNTAIYIGAGILATTAVGILIWASMRKSKTANKL